MRKRLKSIDWRFAVLIIALIVVVNQQRTIEKVEDRTQIIERVVMEDCEQQRERAKRDRRTELDLERIREAVERGSIPPLKPIRPTPPTRTAPRPPRRRTQPRPPRTEPQAPALPAPSPVRPPAPVLPPAAPPGAQEAPDRERDQGRPERGPDRERNDQGRNENRGRNQDRGPRPQDNRGRQGRNPQDNRGRNEENPSLGQGPPEQDNSGPGRSGEPRDDHSDNRGRGNGTDQEPSQSGPSGGPHASVPICGFASLQVADRHTDT